MAIRTAMIGKEAPNNPCAKYDKQGDTISVINSATGQVRGKILKTAPGNAEKLAPRAGPSSDQLECLSKQRGIMGPPIMGKREE